MENMTKRSPIEIVENVLVKIDKFLFPSEFMVMDMLNTRNETMIIGRPFLATIHAEIDVFNKEISLGIGDDDRKTINERSLSFPELLLVKYGETQEKELIWDDRFEEWCNNNPNTPTSRFTTVQENLNPRPKDYPFKDWLLTKLADEYELGIGKKGHMLDDIWENCSRYKEVEFEVSSTRFHVVARFCLGVTTLVTP
ncbi:phospholipase-like protein [Tanacetum coccineum]|uniref:Phospholipase-like protein n=1 Tax=Tanacetum coccineum TaxID=301880 RepID=A0ABQ5CIL1_9ASTR